MLVSVVIPVYNAAETIARCLDSLFLGSLQNVEVICVDDGSTDGSAAILAEYVAQNSHVCVLSQPNCGTFAARKRGVEAARGDYVCFVDPDDHVKPTFIEALVREAERGDWDIVQCGVELEETHERTAKQRAVSERYFNPDAPTLRDGGLLTCAYIHKRIGWNLIFRLFKTSIVKEAFAELPDVNMINETDAAAFFPIAARARRFRRIRDRLYVYRYGEGISTRSEYSLDDFSRTLGKFDFLRAFVPHVTSPESEAAFVAMAARMCENSRRSAENRLHDELSRQQALQLLARRFQHPVRPVRHIGIHYFNLHVGGVQRVLLQEAELIRSLGVKVTLFLEDAHEADDFHVPDGIDVRPFPKSLGNLLPDEERIPLVAAVLRESGIDCWYDHAVFAPGFVINAAVAKWLLGLPVIAHYHTTFTAPMRFRVHPECFDLQAHWLRLADHVLVLGRADAAYFQNRAVNAHVLPNALPLACQQALQKPIPTLSASPRKVLWCGRQSWEKHPEDAEKIVALVRERLPDVELDMVTGVPDPYAHFATASVFLSTSELEGFSMTSAEALAHGLPIVAYRLDNLDLYRDNSAVFQVPCGDLHAAAEAIVDVLRRPDYLELRRSARDSIKRLASFDHKNFWRGFLSGASPAEPFHVTEEDIALAERLESDGREWMALHPHKKNREPITVRRLLRYIKENGIRYTACRAWQRLTASFPHVG